MRRLIIDSMDEEIPPAPGGFTFPVPPPPPPQNVPRETDRDLSVHILHRRRTRTWTCLPDCLVSVGSFPLPQVSPRCHRDEPQAVHLRARGTCRQRNEGPMRSHAVDVQIPERGRCGRGRKGDQNPSPLEVQEHGLEFCVQNERESLGRVADRRCERPSRDNLL